MGAKSILKVADHLGLIPTHLYGKTQHKTLQARLSEDILIERENSVFFRTEPGKFFLREFLTDSSLPFEYRNPITARRRTRDIIKDPILVFHKDDVLNLASEDNVLTKQQVYHLIKLNKFEYKMVRDLDIGDIRVWSFVYVTKQTKILCYRIGRYRENRDSFIFKKSIGFSSMIERGCVNLFNANSLGIIDCGVRATQLDLDLVDYNEFGSGHEDKVLKKFIISSTNERNLDLLAVVEYKCPEWFEPMKRRLAINDLRWIDVNAPANNSEDFDPWSRSALEQEDLWQILTASETECGDHN